MVKEEIDDAPVVKEEVKEELKDEEMKEEGVVKEEPQEEPQEPSSPSMLPKAGLPPSLSGPPRPPPPKATTPVPDQVVLDLQQRLSQERA
eukprot:3405555-Karenia_brevis.AAC.1